MELSQIERPSNIDAKRSLPLETDDEIELIDLSSLTSITSKEEAELSSLNYRISPRHPIKWWINEAGGSWKEYPDGSIELTGESSGSYRELRPKCDAEIKYDICSARRPPYRTITGEKVKPTQIITLLTQNLDENAPDKKIEPSRSASAFPWWNQPDEGYYRGKEKEGLAEFIADTRENYFLVPEGSKLRLKFRCPNMRYNDKVSGRLTDSDEEYVEDYLQNDYELAWLKYPIFGIGHILAHVNPVNDQAVWYCPRCSKKNSKQYGGDGKAVRHTIPQELRNALAKEKIIPDKEYKYKDRLSEVDKLLKLINKNPGIGFYELDHGMGWGTDGRISERIINKRLKNEVDIKRGRGKHKGYKVYIKKQVYINH